LPSTSATSSRFHGRALPLPERKTGHGPGICFIYRDDYYNREASAEPNVAELIIAKQRNGPTGTVRTRFTRECTRFEDVADEDLDLARRS
jgi:hypothetical protein